MTNDDLVKKIGDIVDKKINKALDEKLADTEQRLKTEMTGLKTELVATEQRLKAEMAVSDKRVMADIGSFMEDNLFSKQI